MSYVIIVLFGPVAVNYFRLVVKCPQLWLCCGEPSKAVANRPKLWWKVLWRSVPVANRPDTLKPIGRTPNIANHIFCHLKNIWWLNFIFFNSIQLCKLSGDYFWQFFFIRKYLILPDPFSVMYDDRCKCKFRNIGIHNKERILQVKTGLAKTRVILILPGPLGNNGQYG